MQVCVWTSIFFTKILIIAFFLLGEDISAMGKRDLICTKIIRVGISKVNLNLVKYT